MKNKHILAPNPQQGHRPFALLLLNPWQSSLVEAFQYHGCDRGTTCAVFFNLIKHLCQNIGLVLTEHRALSRAEIVLTATSSHQIYTCTHSETTPEPIAGRFWPTSRRPLHQWNKHESNLKEPRATMMAVNSCEKSQVCTFGSRGPVLKVTTAKRWDWGQWRQMQSDINKRQSYMQV